MNRLFKGKKSGAHDKKDGETGLGDCSFAGVSEGSDELLSEKASAEVSDEVKDIVGKRPIGIIRYGSVAVLLIICSIVVCSKYIVFPEIFRAPLTLNAMDADISFHAESYGQVSKILVSNDQMVGKGEAVGYLESPVDYTRVIRIDSVLDHLFTSADGPVSGDLSRISSDNSFRRLGELWPDLVILLQAYRIWKIQDRRGLDVVHFNGGGSKGYKTENGYEYVKVLTALNTCKREIAEWKKKYVFSSPISGLVRFKDLEKEGQIISRGEELFYVTQPSPHFYGQMQVRQEDLERIKVGDRVSIEVSGFVSPEYGRLAGRIESISGSRDAQGNYAARISLPDGEVTDRKRALALRNGMRANVFIVTGNKALFALLFHRLFNGLASGKPGGG